MGTSGEEIMFLITIAITSFASAVIKTLPLAFLPKMMKSFGFAQKDVGPYIGIAVSVLFAGQMIGSLFWGWLCDRIGAKKCILLTSLLLNVSTLCFGLSTSYAWVVVARLLEGLCGGLFVSIKACVFLYNRKTNTTNAIAVIFTSFQIGTIMGTALGGFLVYPTQIFPNVFPKHSFWETYPFLLPMLVVCSILSVCFIMSYFFIPSYPLKGEPASQKTHLLQEFNTNKIIDDQEVENDKNKEDCCRSCCNKFKESSIILLLKSKIVVMVIALYATASFNDTGANELFPIYADSPLKYGGLDFTTSKIGTALVIACVAVAVLGILVPRIVRFLGARKLIITVSCALILQYPLFPFVGRVPKSELWFVLILSLSSTRILILACNIAIYILLNDAVEPQLIGSVNGLADTVSCFSKMVAPSVLGNLYKLSLENEGKVGFPLDHSLAFCICGLVAVLSNTIAALVPEGHQHKKEDEENE